MRPARLIFVVLCVLQIVGVSGSVVAAAVDIESIIVTGPVFTLLGFAVAGGWIVSRRLPIAIFGLSPGLVSLLLFLLIYLLRWGPHDAQFPVTLTLLGYELLIVPVGLLALYQMATSDGQVAPPRWQFNLRSLLLLTAAVAILCGAGRLAFEIGGPALLLFAICMSITTLGAIGFTGFWAVRRSVGGSQDHQAEIQ